MEPFRFTVALQTKLFLYAILFGAMLGVLYDLFRLSRLVLSSGKVAVFFQDVVYGGLSGLLMYLFCFVFNDGQIRAYVLIGAVLGFIIYYFSIGALLMKAGKKIQRAIRRVNRWVVRVVGRPFRWIFKKCSKRFGFLANIAKKRKKKSTNKTILCLKHPKVLVYNLLKAFSKNRKKEGESDEAQQEEKKT